MAAYAIYITQTTGGTLRVSPEGAPAGRTILMAPINDTGYIFAGFTSISPSGLVISGNQFIMPDQEVFLTPRWDKLNYTITKESSPSGSGTVSVKENGTEVTQAQIGDALVITQTPAEGYSFKGWTTSPAINIGSGGAATMPASNLTVRADYRKKSIPTVNTKSLQGGGTLQLTIGADKASYSHKYRLYFDSNMDTGWVDAGHGSKTETISVPLNWSQYIPNATSKTGGVLYLETFDGQESVGTNSIQGFTYNVPASVIPTIGTITTSIERTIGGTTYANIGNLYVQNHCGVRTQTSAAGAQGSTIANIGITISGYSGSNYNKLVTGASLDTTSGLLSIAGNTTITIIATDSRGRQAIKTASIHVTAYSKPSGRLSLRRVDADGDDDDMGIYGKYAFTKNWTPIGSNALSWTLSYSGGSGSGSSSTTGGLPESGDVFPSSRKSFQITQEYTFTLTLADSLETTVITAKLPSARFIIAADSDGNRLGIMKFPNKAIPAGKNRTFEISDDTQVYIGDQTLEAFVGLYKGTLGQGDDLNDIRTTGAYLITTNVTHAPAPNVWMLCMGEGGITAQVVFHEDSVGFRCYKGNPMAWTNWKYLTP